MSVVDMAVQDGSIAYVLLWRPDHIWLVGPFVDGHDAGEWGSTNAYGADDNPCWQVVCLPPGHDRVMPVMDPGKGFVVP